MSVNTVKNGKLHQVAGNAFGIVDSKLSTESTNPVQNKAVAEKFVEVEESVYGAKYSLENILDGTTAVGDSKKFDGSTRDSFMGDKGFIYKAHDLIDLDTITYESHISAFNPYHAPTNKGAGDWWFVDTGVSTAGYIRQIASSFEIFHEGVQHIRQIFIRTKWINSNWTDWTPLLTPDMISNPNLIINPDGQIDQRGNGYYDSTTETVLFEPWMLISAGNNVAMSLNSDKNIVITQKNKIVSSALCGIFQREGTLQIKRGLTYTFSFKYKTSSNNAYAFPEIFSIDKILRDNLIGDNEWHIYSRTGVYGTNNIDWVGVGFVNANLDETIEIEWLKLEEGNIATQFTTPDPATELVKCQRYFNLLHFPVWNSITYAANFGKVLDITKEIPPMAKTPKATLINVNLNSVANRNAIGVLPKTNPGNPGWDSSPSRKCSSALTFVTDRSTGIQVEPITQVTDVANSIMYIGSDVAIQLDALT